MILVSVGGVKEYKFDRLFRIIDELCDEKFLNGEEIIAQTGFNDYVPRNYKSYDFISNEDFKKMSSEAEFMISHAGTGTVVSAVKQGTKVIIFPRLAEFNEHLDNHQLELCDLFESQGYALVAKDKEELKEKITQIKNFTPKQFISNNRQITQMIIEFIEK